MGTPDSIVRRLFKRTPFSALQIIAPAKVACVKQRRKKSGNRPTDGPTDIPSYRVALTQLKKEKKKKKKEKDYEKGKVR